MRPQGCAKLAQVVPYALEERVADEIEHLHFPSVTATRSRPHSRGGARARAHRKRGWRSCGRGTDPQAIYSAATCCPPCPAQMIGLLEGEHAGAAHRGRAPLMLPALSITDAFEMALSVQSSVVAGLEPAIGLLLYAATMNGRRIS